MKQNRPKTRFLKGLLTGILLVPLCAYVYLRLGYAPAATSAPPFPFEKTIASMALNAHIAKEAPAKTDIPLTEDALMEGAKVYREYCAVCHGIGSEPKSPTARGMYPPPPQLFQGKGVTDDPVGETYWKVANGIRLTGMPGYRGSLMDTQLWQVTLLVSSADKLPPPVSAFLTNPAPAR
jgi:mono/diheme cytochrome c family protein